MDTDEAIAFIKEREERIGGKILYRTYSTWYGRIGREKREYGVFLYSDGKSFIYEDFERNPQILGIPIKTKKKEKYEKLEVSFPVSEIMEITRVTKRSAEVSLYNGKDLSKHPNIIDKAFRPIVTKVVLGNGDVLFFELMDPKEFEASARKFRSNA